MGTWLDTRASTRSSLSSRLSLKREPLEPTVSSLSTRVSSIIFLLIPIIDIQQESLPGCEDPKRHFGIIL